MKRLSLPLMTAVGLMGMAALTACGSGSTDSATSASAAMTPSASSTPSPSSTLSGTVTDAETSIRLTVKSLGMRQDFLTRPEDSDHDR